MALLWSFERNQLERVLDEQVDAYLRTKKYGVPPEYTAPMASGQPGVRITTPTGKTGLVPQATLRNALDPKKGNTLTSSADKFAQGFLGMHATGFAGGISGLTFGLSDAAAAAAGAPFMVEALRTQNPGIRAVSEIGTALVSTAAGAIATAPSGGAATPLTAMGAAKLAKAINSLRAVKIGAALTPQIAKSAAKETVGIAKAAWGSAKGMAPYTPTGLASQWSARSTDSAANLLLKELTRGRKPGMLTNMIARGTGMGLTAGAEGALWGLGSALTESALGSPEEVGELLAAHMVPSTLWSAGLSFGLGGAAGMFSRPLRAKGNQIKNKLSKWLEPDGDLKTAFDNSWEANTANELGINGAQLSRIKRAVEDGVDVLMDPNVLPDGGIWTPRDGRVLTDREIKKRLQTVRQQAAAQLDVLWQQADAGLPLKDYYEVLREAFLINPDKFARKITQRTWADVVDDLRNRMLAEPLGTAGGRAAPHLSLLEARELRGQLGDFWRKAAKSVDPSVQDKAAAYRMAERVLKNAAIEHAAPALGVGTVKLVQADKLYHSTNAIYNEVKKAQAKIKGGFLHQLLQRGSQVAGWRLASTTSAMTGRVIAGGAGASAGAVAGGMVGGLGGAALGATFGATLPVLIMPRAAAAAELAHWAARLANWDDVLSHMESRVSTAVAKWLRGTRSSIPVLGTAILRTNGRDEDPRKAAIKLRRQLAAMANPQLGADRLSMATLPMRQTTPQAALHAQMALGRVYSAADTILSQLLLKASPESRLQPGLAMDLKSISDGDLERAGLALSAVFDPLAVVEEVFDGTATPQQIQLLQQLWPQVWNLAVQHVALATATATKPLTGKQRAVLAQMGLAPGRAPGPMTPPQPAPSQGRGLTQSAIRGTQKAPEMFATTDNRRARDAGASLA